MSTPIKVNLPVAEYQQEQARTIKLVVTDPTFASVHTLPDASGTLLSTGAQTLTPAEKAQARANIGAGTGSGGGGGGSWGEIIGTLSDQTDLQSALDAKADAAATTAALAGKSNTGHTHAIADTTGLQAALDAKAGSSHTHTKADVGLGNVDNTSDASKPISTATQAALDGKAATSHTHAIANVTGLQSALDAKQATLVSGTNIKTVNGSSILGSGDLAISGGSSSTSYTANATPTTHYFTIEGESIGASLGTKLASLSEFSGKVNHSNLAVAGSDFQTMRSRWTAGAYTRRPAANGGPAGVLVSDLLQIIGINDLSGCSSKADFWSRVSTHLTPFINDAKAAGMRLGFAMPYYGAGFYRVGTSDLVEGWRAELCSEFCEWLSNHAEIDYVLNMSELVRGYDSQWMNPDRVHLTTSTNGGYDALAKFINDVIKAGPSAQVRRPALVRGTSARDLASNQTIPYTAHVSQGPQKTNQFQTLAYAALMAWDVSSKQNITITLTGDGELSASGAVPGLPGYALKVYPNGHTLDFHYQQFKFPGGQPTATTTADSDLYDLYIFMWDGVVFQCIHSIMGLDDSPVPEVGVQLFEDFTSATDDTSNNLSGTAADTNNPSGFTWSGNGVVRRLNNGAQSATGANGARGDMLIYDNYSIEVPVSAYNAGSGTNFRVVFGFNPASDPATNACLVLWFGQTDYALRVHPTGFNNTATQEHSKSRWASGINTPVDGDVWRIELIGTSLKCYKNGVTEFLTLTLGGANGSSNTGIGIYLTSSIRIDYIKVRDLTA